ncbi:MAG: hypothetical protein EXR45_05670 [Chloroflexi bacterium]|nr:hypothetical protein [Chloroflexota bacterium]
MIRFLKVFASPIPDAVLAARLVLALFFLPASLALASFWVYVVIHQDRVYAGFRVLGQPVGGLTVGEVRAAVERAVAEKLASKITFLHEDEAWPRGVEALGIEVDGASIASTIAMTLSSGHTGTGRQWLSDQFRLMTVGVEVPVRFRVDRNRARASLETVARALERSPVDAEVSIGPSGERSDLQLIQSQVGQKLNVEGTLDRLEASLVNGVPSSVTMVMDIRKPQIDERALSTVVGAAKVLLDSPLEIIDDSGPTTRQWRLDPVEASRMLILDLPGGEARTRVTGARFNEAKLRDWVARVAASASQEARNPYIELLDGVLKTTPGRPGRVVDVDATTKRLVDALPTSVHAVQLVVRTDEPWVSVSEVDAARRQIERALQEPLMLRLNSVSDAPVLVRVDSTTMLGWVDLPQVQKIPRDTSRQAPQNRPRLEWRITSERLVEFVTREIAQAIAVSPIDARLLVVAKPGVASSAVTPTPTPSPAGVDETDADLRSGIAVELQRLRSTPARVATLTPSGGAATAIARATSLAPGQSASPTASVVFAMFTVITVTPSDARPTPTAISTPDAGGVTTFGAYISEGTVGRAVDVEALARLVDDLLHRDIEPLNGLLIVPPTPLPAGGSQGQGPADARTSPSATNTATATPTATPSRTATATRTATQTATHTTTPIQFVNGVTGTVSALTPVASGSVSVVLATASPSLRVVDVPATVRRPNVVAADLVGLKSLVGRLVGEPIKVIWNDVSWEVMPNDLVDLLRIGVDQNQRPTAYLSRDGLVEVSERIARLAERLPDAPRDKSGDVLPVDVPRTAAALWAAANEERAARRMAIVWTEEQPEIDEDTQRAFGLPTATPRRLAPTVTPIPARTMVPVGVLPPVR